MSAAPPTRHVRALGGMGPSTQQGLKRRARIASVIGDTVVSIDLSSAGLCSPRALDGQGVVVLRVLRTSAGVMSAMGRVVNRGTRYLLSTCS